ncbi:type II secretion system F family protein [Venenivibrio stagnispumantis]|uniref:General secretion pathway protein F/type IV pilus assembly protein PilC n=1 Tax=Venenivibrio stagnispumantis TaxID=407998 RepID=A0AA45WIG7_9AQUI|nr:type II secretion system F family protein [Venenivibrio stagnispumantis]MCW4572608.1 type II secretion system F family protein [Venenivibrio stagnispumantis]SMP00526.1 general secretion pathway protein F/type IV pilus assembly protein PilC [Venenivibrio stagnispumantis]
MKIYIVEAVDTEGNIIKKMVKVNDETEIELILKAQNLEIIDIKPVPVFIEYLINFNPFKKKKIKKQEIIEFLENLHLVVKSGMPVGSGIMDLAETNENPAFKDILLDIHSRVLSGTALSEAFKVYENIFGNVIITLIRIGEETGNLEKVLKDGAEYLKRIEDIKAKTKQALIYPTFTFVAMSSAMIFWLVYVLPKLTEAFKNFNIELPVTTLFLIWLSEKTQKYILDIIAFLFFSFIFLKIGRKRNEKIKYITDKILLKLPIFGIIITYFNFAFIAEYLRLMIKSGVNITQSLNILGESLNNAIFKKAIKDASEDIYNGESISNAFQKQQMFSPMIIRMIYIGENTGQLEEQLNYISDYYYGKVNYISQNIAKMIEPILISMMGIFMLIIILGLLGPIYNLISVVGKG